jgi:1,4-dihydroxy-2-naphthoate octaprenyltransferase
MAIGNGAHRVLPAAAALLGALLIQVGTNLANDYYDHVRGGDTEDRVGPIRVTQAGLISPREVRAATFLVLGLALVVGVYLAWIGGWPIVIIGILSLVCAVAYTGGPFPLAYHGLGDPFVFVFFGLVAVGGTYWVQALDIGAEVLLAGAGMGALNTAILVVNNLRDVETDRRAGKNTLAVRLGIAGTKVEYLGLLLLALATPVLGIQAFSWTPWALLGLLAAIPLVGPTTVVVRHREDADPRSLIPPLGGTAQAAGLFGLLLGLGLALG